MEVEQRAVLVEENAAHRASARPDRGSQVKATQLVRSACSPSGRCPHDCCHKKTTRKIGGRDERAQGRTYLFRAEVEERLGRTCRDGSSAKGVVRRYKTGSWKGTLMVITTVGHLAEAAWHHPDMPPPIPGSRCNCKNHSARASPTRTSNSPGRSRTSSPGSPERRPGPRRNPAEPRFAYMKYDT